MRKVDLRDSPRDSKDFVNDAGEAIGSADDAARGRGVYAVVDIKAGERVLTVPCSACISQAGLGKGASALADAEPAPLLPRGGLPGPALGRRHGNTDHR